MKVRCINDEYVRNITRGVEYIVIKEEENRYVLRNDIGNVTSHLKRRFEKTANKNKDIYLDFDLGIRKDYLYDITMNDSMRILGEILNRDCGRFHIKSYKRSGEFNHYIVSYRDIRTLYPCMTIEQFNKQNNL